MAGNRHYLSALFPTIVGTWLFLGAVNLLIDPYGLFRLVARPGFNAVKPRPDHSLAEIKLASVLDYKANALIVGNSRAEIGFDPEHPVWARHALKAFNLAVPGSGIQDSAVQMKEVENKLQPKLVLLGLDFLDFLVDPSTPEITSEEYARFDARDRLRLSFSSLFSIQATVDSLRTLHIQGTPEPESMTDKGFNPLLDYRKIARDDGYYSMFRQRALSNAQRFARMPKRLFKNGSKNTQAWDSLRIILDEALKGNGSVKIIIYPYHAQLLAMFEQNQLWPAFEAWKEYVVEIAQSVQGKNPGRIEIWDFSGFSDYQCESIPPKSDKQSVVRWYWEAGHFKKELGDIILTRLFDTTENGQPSSSQIFGMRLTPSSLQENKARIQSERERCRVRNPEIFSEAAELAAKEKSRTAF